MSDVFTEISGLLDAEDASVQGAIDTENQRHADAVAPLTKRQADLAQVRTTLAQLEQQATSPAPAPEPASDATAAPAATSDAAGEAAAPATPEAAADTPPAEPVEIPTADPSAPVPDDHVALTSASTGAIAVVPQADVVAATDPTISDGDLTPPQAALRNSDYL